MRTLILLIIGASAAAALTAQTFTGSPDEPEPDLVDQTLVCDEALLEGCEVRCTTADGALVYLQSDVQRVFLTETAGHTLVQVQQRLPVEVRSALIGSLANCDLRGLRAWGFGRRAPLGPP